MTAHTCQPHAGPEAAEQACQRLSAPAARLLRLLARHPGPAIPLPLAAALHGGSEGDTHRLLDELSQSGLLTGPAMEDEGLEWRLDEPARQSARRLAQQHPGEGPHAVDVICGWYLDAAIAAAKVAAPGRVCIGDRYRVVPPGRYPGAVAALDWLEEQMPALVGVLRLAHGTARHAVTWQLCDVLAGMLRVRGPYPLWVETHTLGAHAARLLGDRRALARMLVQLGQAHLRMHDHRQAETLIQEALSLSRASQDRPGEADALEHLGLINLRAGRPAQAITVWRETSAIHRETGDRRGIGLALLHIAQANHQAADYSASARALAEARWLIGLDDPYDRLRIAIAGARNDLDSGHPRFALPRLERALALAREIGARTDEAHVRELLAGLLTRRAQDGHAGDNYALLRAADAHRRAAHDLYSCCGDPTSAANVTDLPAL